MKNKNKDILTDKIHLKEMPYSIPDEYFDGLKKNLTSCQKTSAWNKITPYVALAAMFAMLVAAGSFFLEHASKDNYTQEDYLVFSENMTNIIFDEYDEQYADAISEDDIIEYLIYTGTEIDELY